MYDHQQNTPTPAPPQMHPQSPQHYILYHDFHGPAELTTTLLHAISDVTGFDVTNTEFTLSDYVNLDALNQLFEPKPDGSPRTNGDFRVTIWGCQVTIYSCGQIVIVPPHQQPSFTQ